jgi:hypothetical protein
MAPARKDEVITFKVNAALAEAMAGIPNRSDFIRKAVVAALDGACPLCRGTGILTPAQRKHWRSFAISHSVEECEECHEPYLVCAQAKAAGR